MSRSRDPVIRREDEQRGDQRDERREAGGHDPYGPPLGLELFDCSGQALVAEPEGNAADALPSQVDGLGELRLPASGGEVW